MSGLKLYGTASSVTAGRLVAITVIPPLQRRVAIVRGGAILAGSVGGRSPPQARLAGVLVIDYLAPVLQRRQPRFHILELRGSHRILRPRREYLLDLFLGFGNAVWRLRMSREGLGQRARLLLFHRLQFLEERNKRLRVIPCLVHILQAQIVRLGLKAPLEAQKSHRQSQTGCRP